MKKTFLLLLMLIGLTSTSFAQANIKNYNVLHVKNSAGDNFVDLTLSYDTYSNCYNNIYIEAKRDINIYFQVYLDDKKVYDGWAKMGKGQTYFLDDAFIDCKSSFKEVLIQTQARFE